MKSAKITSRLDKTSCIHLQDGQAAEMEGLTGCAAACSIRDCDAACCPRKVFVTFPTNQTIKTIPSMVEKISTGTISALNWKWPLYCRGSELSRVMATDRK